MSIRQTLIESPDLLSEGCALQGEHLTYKQLDEKANQVARFLEANGVKDEQPVGVMLERSLELMIAMMGVLKAGGAFVPMDPEYPADRLALMAEDAEVGCLTRCSFSTGLLLPSQELIRAQNSPWEQQCLPKLGGPCRIRLKRWSPTWPSHFHFLESCCHWHALFEFGVVFALPPRIYSSMTID